MFILYTTLLGQICRNGIHYHLYADDSQLYMSFKLSKPGSKEKCLQQLEGCISDIRLWMVNNMLKLNDEKTEFIFFGTCQQLTKISDINIIIGSTKIQPIEEVRNLGYFMDKLLKNSVHINKLSAMMFHNLRNIRQIQNKLDFDSTKTVIQALNMSKLNYCNALLPGSSKMLLTKLQSIQKMACRIVCNLKKFDHITQPMYDLHWLCIQEIIDYKIVCIKFKCHKGTAPQYLMDLLPKIQSKWQLRSSTSNVCQTKFFKTSQGYNSSFSSYGPRIWNALPSELQQAQSFDSFRKGLKTHLFEASYDKNKFTSFN